jgi:hypothetical protein
MKSSHIILLNILFFSVIACANKQPSTEEKINQNNDATITTTENATDSFPTQENNRTCIL